MRARRLPPDGFAAYRRAQKRSWEGIVGKDAASLYEPGRRTRSWLKVKCRKEAEFVIGGFTAPRRPLQRSRSPIRREGRDRILRETLAEVAAQMRALRTPASPFRPAPREAGITWIRPKLVAQIAFAEWTADGKLRQPVLLGLRRDKKPSECTWRTREL
jgi:bifunctional non-homologous end joining protein LigD